MTATAVEVETINSYAMDGINLMINYEVLNPLKCYCTENEINILFALLVTLYPWGGLCPK